MTAAAIERHQAATEARTVEFFMKGKCLAAMLALESMGANADTTANLCASFRDAGVQQDNYARKFLHQLLERPELLDGFSAGLSSIMGEAMETLIGNAESVATISYEACTVHYPYDEANHHDCYTAPALDEQIKAYGFDALAAGSMPSMIDVTGGTVPPSVANREATEEPDAWSPCAYALLVTLAMAERENDPLTWAFHRVVEAAKEAIEALDQQPDDTDRLGVAQDVVREAQTMAGFLRCNRDRDMDGAAELLLKLSAQALEAQIAGQA